MNTMKLCSHCMKKFESIEGIQAIRSNKNECYLSSIGFNQSNIRMKVN